ncbi:MAG: agmatinase [Candidatus Aenigmatarchaeota archaeon]
MKSGFSGKFMNLPPAYSGYKKSQIAILPVPFDGTSTWMKGADKGPEALVSASGYLEYCEPETKAEVCDNGIYTDKPVISKTPESMIKDTYERVKALLADGKFVVTLGGEHSISVGPIRAHAEKFAGLSVLHLDAHGDRRDEYHGSRCNHGCVIARAKESVRKVVSVGIRSFDSSEMESLDEDKVFYAHEIHGRDDWISKAVNSLSDNVYITIDLDVFEIGIMPSTGTPEPGGLGWYEVTRLLRAVVEKKNIVGFDVVELCPDERNKAPDFLAAKLVQVLLSYIFFLGRRAEKKR